MYVLDDQIKILYQIGLSKAAAQVYACLRENQLGLDAAQMSGLVALSHASLYRALTELEAKGFIEK